MESPKEVDGESVKLEANDIEVLIKAACMIREEPGLALKAELTAFKDLVLSWGGSLEPLPAASAPAAGANGGASSKAGAPDRPAAPVDLLLEDSDEEMEVSGPAAEMLLPPNLLSNEFADEPPAKGEEIRLEDLVPKDTGPYPPFPPRNYEAPSDARKRVLAKVKEQATELLQAGKADQALEKYSEIIRTGGATALIMAARAEILLKLSRPCAAIRDCCLALHMNKDCGKAHHVRGAAHHRLGHWKKAHRDLTEGQRLDFQEQSVGMLAYVSKKSNLVQDKKTGQWQTVAEAAKKAAQEKKAEEEERRRLEELRKPKGPSKDFKSGQAVRLFGLQKAPQLNGKRGLIQRLGPANNDRWDVEIRLERGRVETKSILSQNIYAVSQRQAADWQLEEARWSEDRKKREKDEKRWKLEEEKQKKLDAMSRKSGDGLPTMDPSEKLEAEMSALPLDQEALALLRRLRPTEALDVLTQVRVQGINSNMSSYIKIKVKSKLGMDDDEDEKPMPQPVHARTPPPPSAPSPPPPAAPPQAPSPPPPAAAASAAQEVAESSDEESEDEDFDLMPEEKQASLGSGYVEPEPTEKQQEAIARWKQEAQDALDVGNSRTALERFTEVIEGGGASALMLTKRGELLLKERRPLAAIKDCSAAIRVNEDLGKAYRIRGIAYRKLGRYREARSDLVQAQKLDFDEGISAIEKFVSSKVRQEEKKQRKRRRTQ
eukprot:TRINITY_DN8961_c0_g2_i2.p1 TRINITY_DN8961_c0_g2~~TRINITY_DN8961_c0_g2_i2.p1  ORF type:complete len:726 (+),score=213.13 TRINITY_DN8961_c0_g2_i2:32-2179(+)